MAPNKTLAGHKLLILLAVEPPAEYLSSLKSAFPDLAVEYRKSQWVPESDPVPAKVWADVTILFSLWTFPTPDEAPRLQYVQLQTAGAEHVLGLPLFKDTDVVFCTANGVHGPQISEWISSTYLAFTHQLPRLLSQQRDRNWNRGDLTTFDDAANKTVGILGYGSIGRQTARVATAMGMRVYAYTLHPRETPESRRDRSWAPDGLGDPEGVFPSKWFSGGTTADLHAFLASGLDLLVIATPLTNDTRHIIGAGEFRVLADAGKGRTFVSNVGRGPIINTGDLIAALEEGLIAGAALDVTDPEPLPEEHALWGAPNLIITPHVSGASKAYAERVLAILRHNLGKLSEGVGPTNQVDKKRGY